MPIQYKKSRGFGEIDDNYTEGTLVNNTALTITITVPSGEIWLLYGGRVKNGDDVARTISVKIKNSSDKIILNMAYQANLGAGSSIVYPNTTANLLNYNNGLVILKSGWKIEISYAAGGTSSGGTAEVSAIVEKFKV